MGILDRLFAGIKTKSDNPYPSQFTNTVCEILRRLEIVFDVKSENVINLTFSFDESDGTERTQFVVITSTGEENQFVTVSSPIGKVDDIGDKLTAEFMNELLEANNNSIGFGYALEDAGDSEYLVTCSDQILATLDDSELRNAMVFCAGAADEIENQLGLGDEY